MRTEDNGQPTLFFQVANTGIGMSSARQQNLFQPFTQANAGISRRFGGAGLRLSISHILLELLGGEIAVSSNLGQGTTFAFQCASL